MTNEQSRKIEAAADGRVQAAQKAVANLEKLLQETRSRLEAASMELEEAEKSRDEILNLLGL